MTTYLGEKAVGIGSIKAEIGVSGDVLHDNTLKGNGNTEPLGVDTEVIATTAQVGNLAKDVRDTLDAFEKDIGTTITEAKEDINNKIEDFEKELDETISGLDANNFVKKSGDTMTGDLAFEDYSAAHPQKHVLRGDSSFSIEYYYNNEQYPRQTWNFAGASLFASSTTGVKPFLGHPTRPWDNIYAKKLNNGADITIPTLGGTLARIEDIQNATTTLNAGITGNAQAIQKTREDYIQADSEIHQMLNGLSAETTTIKNNQASLGTQVANIEHKIPQSASGSNPLITKQQLLDEEMDIREDLNETSSELQTQITAQATEVNKLKEAIAGLGSLSYSVVDVLPEVGEKGVIYLVPKDGEQPDVHDEYLWVDGQFELIGTTQVDLTGYVKDTDYAKSETAGVIKISSSYGLDSTKQNGILAPATYTLSNYSAKAAQVFIGKGTLENIKDDYVKRGITENTITLTDEEKAAAQAWLGVESGGGDYLPLSGGTLTGSLVLTKGSYDNPAIQFANSGYKMYINGSVFTLTRNIDTIFNYDPLDKHVRIRTIAPLIGVDCDVGTSDNVWRAVYTKNLNNGADIAVPTTGGTMALKEDIDAAVGDISTALTAILGE